MFRLIRDANRAARQFNAPRSFVAKRLARLYLRHGVPPREALVSGLADASVAEEFLDGCIGKNRLVRMQEAVNPESHECLTEDKAVFYRYCQAVELPIPRLYGVVDVNDREPRVGGRDWYSFLTSELPSEFVVKPALGVYGEGFFALTRTSEGFAVGMGTNLSASQVMDLMRGTSYDRYVVQERLWNHPELDRLSGTRFLQTVRIMTLVRRDGEIRIFAPFLRVITAGNRIDNIRDGLTGNLPVAVRPEDGVLCGARTFCRGRLGMEPMPRHPETGRDVEGFRVPFWEEARQLVTRAARLFLPLKTIGWDVAITPDGPVLVEGNVCWDPPNWTPRNDPSGMAALLRELRIEVANAGPT